MVHVSDELKEVIIKEHIEKGRTYRSLSAEYGYSIGAISDRVRKFRKECQESQYCSRAFTEYCDKAGVLQSMSRAGCPYDNAPMERYFTTLKYELIYQKEYKDEKTLYEDIVSYAHGWYNNVRPHTYNGGIPPKKVILRK